MRKLTKAQLKHYAEELRLHNKSLKQQHRHSEMLTLEQYIDVVFGTSAKPTGSSRNVATPGANRRHTHQYPSHGVQNTSADACCRKERQRYSGHVVKGIATMHKSNAVPVTGKEQATDIAKMRRG